MNIFLTKLTDWSYWLWSILYRDFIPWVEQNIQRTYAQCWTRAHFPWKHTPFIHSSHSFIQNYILFSLFGLLENTKHLPLIWKWIDSEQWVIMLSMCMVVVGRCNVNMSTLHIHGFCALCFYWLQFCNEVSRACYIVEIVWNWITLEQNVIERWCLPEKLWMWITIIPLDELRIVNFFIFT